MPISAPDGRYTLPELDAYWTDPWRHPFLVRVEDQLAGFAIVHQKGRITGDMTTRDVAEFFVMRKYRRRGVCAVVARQLFESFRGAWEVRQLALNHSATSLLAYRKLLSYRVLWFERGNQRRIR
jgi:predicted acetyltransferase